LAPPSRVSSVFAAVGGGFGGARMVSIGAVFFGPHSGLRCSIAGGTGTDDAASVHRGSGSGGRRARRQRGRVAGRQRRRVVLRTHRLAPGTLPGDIVAISGPRAAAAASAAAVAAPPPLRRRRLLPLFRPFAHVAVPALSRGPSPGFIRRRAGRRGRGCDAPLARAARAPAAAPGVPAAAAAVPALPPVERHRSADALSATVPLLRRPVGTSRVCPAHRAERSHVNDREVVVRPAELEVAPDGF
jgi:hypothetical protein